MWSLFKFILICVAFAALGSRLSNVNPDACSRGSLSCGTAWWLLLGLAGALLWAVWRLRVLANQIAVSSSSVTQPAVDTEQCLNADASIQATQAALELEVDRARRLNDVVSPTPKISGSTRK